MIFRLNIYINKNNMINNSLKAFNKITNLLKTKINKLK